MAKIRISGGFKKGQYIKMPPGGLTRPAMNRVKQALFSILGNSIVGAKFLDLFAGSGSLGLEALSRGASYAVFVDNSPLCTKTIKENLKNLGFDNQSQVFCQDCYKFLKSNQNFSFTFDIVCIDPPYSKGLLQPILDTLSNSLLFNKETLFIVERQSKDIPILTEENKLKLIKEKKFGATILSFYKII